MAGATTAGSACFTDSGHAQIKAGYGYELKLEVSYKTNAFSTQPGAFEVNGSGQSVRPENVMPNLSQDIYFKTPDGKILSVSGLDGMNATFQPKVLSFGPDHLDVEYTMKSVTTLDIPSPGRICIGEITPNGVYHSQTWTPQISGVPTKNPLTDSNGLTLFNPSPLMDRVGTATSNYSAVPTNGTDANGNPIVDTAAIPPMSIAVAIK